MGLYGKVEWDFRLIFIHFPDIKIAFSWKICHKSCFEQQLCSFVGWMRVKQR